MTLVTATSPDHFHVNSGVWTQVLRLGRQVLHCLSHLPSLQYSTFQADKLWPPSSIFLCEILKRGSPTRCSALGILSKLTLHPAERRQNILQCSGLASRRRLIKGRPFCPSPFTSRRGKMSPNQKRVLYTLNGTGWTCQVFPKLSERNLRWQLCGESQECMVWKVSFY